MLDASVRTSPQVVTFKNEAPVKITGQSKVGAPAEKFPTEPGMYVATSEGFTKILGQILDFTRTGSRLVSGLTLHIKQQRK